MGILASAILLLHPLVACTVLVWMWLQYGWKKKSTEMKGEERKNELERHEKNGERLLQLAIGTILLAFIAKGIVAFIVLKCNTASVQCRFRMHQNSGTPVDVRLLDMAHGYQYSLSSPHTFSGR